MKVLYVTPFNPLERSCGGAIRSGALFSALRRMGEVRTVVLAGQERMVTGEEEKFHVRFLDFGSTYCRRIKWPIFILLSCLFRNPNWGFPGKRQIVQMLGVSDFDYDCVVVRYVWCAIKIGAWKLGPLFIDVDDSPEGNFETNVAPKRNFLIRPLAKFVYLNWQHLVCRFAAGLWVSNANDSDVLMKYCRNTVCLPNVSQGPKDGYVCRGDGGFLLSIGSFGFPPNYLGVDRFLDEYWPRILETFPKMRYKIVGRSLPERYRLKWSKIKNVEILGFVDDLDGLYASCFGVVAALWQGAGTSVKSVEALKYGCKLFATPVALRGFCDELIRNCDVSVFGDGRHDLIGDIGVWLGKDAVTKVKIRNKIKDAAVHMNTEDDVLLAAKRCLTANNKLQ